MIKNILITGRPGCGKSTLLTRVARGKKIGGISTPDVRQKGVRFGFKIKDLKTGREEILASIQVKEGPKVSKYKVDLVALDKIGSTAIEKAVKDKDIELLIIDEIGKMECFSERFKRAVIAALDSKKPVLATISLKDFDPLITKIKQRKDCKLFYLTRENFDITLKEVKDLLK